MSVTKRINSSSSSVPPTVETGGRTIAWLGCHFGWRSAAWLIFQEEEEEEVPDDVCHCPIINDNGATLPLNVPCVLYCTLDPAVGSLE